MRFEKPQTGAIFSNEVAEELDLNVSLISGQEEARRIYLGVLSAMEFNNQSQVIIDIGGGSTELILGDSLEPRCLTSTKIGAVRLTGEFVKSDPINQRGVCVFASLYSDNVRKTDR